MSSTQDLQWLLTRKTSCFLVKQKGLARVFSREPNNLAQIHSYRYSGLVNDKNVSVEASKSGKGLVVSTKKADSAPGKIAGSRSTQSLKRGGPRHKAGAVAQIVGKKGYRSDLLKGKFFYSSSRLYAILFHRSTTLEPA
jgi:large subunit ribosomal protein L28e